MYSDEYYLFWQSVPRLKAFLKWLTIATCAFLLLIILPSLLSLMGFSYNILPLIGFSNNVVLLIIVSGIFPLAVVWYGAVIVLNIVYTRWSIKQRHLRK